jgi:DNA-directed RNA polymerase subunit RPC12/RpoP
MEIFMPGKRRLKRPAHLELECPGCGRSVRVARRDVYAGAQVRCTHCGAGAVLEREYDENHDSEHWTLEPVDEEDEY